MIALLLDGPLDVLPNRLVTMLDMLDDAHVWTHAETQLVDPEAVLRSPTSLVFIASGPHGGMLTLMRMENPLPPGLAGEAKARSWWYDGGDAVLGHRDHCLIATGTPNSWQNAVLMAKAGSLIAASLVQSNASITGVWNGVNGTLFTPASVVRDLGIIADGEVPLMFWVFNGLHSLTAGDVSMTTGGLAPFVGYEIEIWHAPLTAEVVVEKLNGLLKYLLASGPVINDGDTIGADDAERITCRFGPSRDDRPQPVTAMFLTFGAAVAPKPSLRQRWFGKN